MRIHSNTLTQGDSHQAIAAAGLTSEGVFLDGIMRHGSRSRHHAFEVHLGAFAGRDRNGKARRAANSGHYGAAGHKAATYDEWGYWIAQLFELDADAIVGPYKGRDHFHQITRGDYAIEVTA